MQVKLILAWPAVPALGQAVSPHACRRGPADRDRRLERAGARVPKIRTCLMIGAGSAAPQPVRADALQRNAFRISGHPELEIRLDISESGAKWAGRDVRRAELRPAETCDPQRSWADELAPVCSPSACGFRARARPDRRHSLTPASPPPWHHPSTSAPAP